MLDVDIHRRLGDFCLDVAFTGPETGITALFGPSGCGKSSAVSAIAGLLRPDAGHVRLGATTFFDSAQRIDVPLRHRRIGYVFQDARLFPHMRVEDNLRYGLRRVPDGDARIAFDGVIELLGLAPLLDRRPRALSGGERQRVALGRALLAQPRLLLMDEPLASLDAGRKEEIIPYIDRLRDQVQLPIVYVSHALDEVVRLADALVVLRAGQVAAAGDVADVLSRLDLFPVDSPYEAGALLRVRVASHDERFALTRLTFDGGELLVPRLPDPVGCGLRIRIRARDVMLALTEPAEVSALNTLRAHVRALQVQDACHLDVQLAIGEARLVSRITRQSAERLALTPGMPVFAVIKSVAIDGRYAGATPPAAPRTA